MTPGRLTLCSFSLIRVKLMTMEPTLKEPAPPVLVDQRRLRLFRRLTSLVDMEQSTLVLRVPL